MIICIDCGNTTIGIACYVEEKLDSYYSIFTDKKKSADEYCIIVKNLLKETKKEEVKGIILSSVVPEVTNKIKSCFAGIFNVEPYILNSKMKTKMPIKLDNPSELGSDLLADAVGAKNRYGVPVLIADFGTATKIIVVDKNGNFSGGIIMPGIDVSFNSLISSTSLLTHSETDLPKNVCGRNGKDAINSGVLYGQIEAIKGLTNCVEKEFGYEFKKILTGGFSYLVQSELTEFVFDKYLLTDGLLYIYNLNEK